LDDLSGWFVLDSADDLPASRHLHFADSRQGQAGHRGGRGVGLRHTLSSGLHVLDEPLPLKIAPQPLVAGKLRVVESTLGVVEVPAQGRSICVPPLDLWEQNLKQLQPLDRGESWAGEE
jgi:hypothetical protein